MALWKTKLTTLALAVALTLPIPASAFCVFGVVGNTCSEKPQTIIQQTANQKNDVSNTVNQGSVTTGAVTNVQGAVTQGSLSVTTADKLFITNFAEITKQMLGNNTAFLNLGNFYLEQAKSTKAFIEKTVANPPNIPIKNADTTILQIDLPASSKPFPIINEYTVPTADFIRAENQKIIDAIKGLILNPTINVQAPAVTVNNSTPAISPTALTISAQSITDLGTTIAASAGGANVTVTPTITLDTASTNLLTDINQAKADIININNQLMTFTGGGGGNTKTITQTAHGFTVGQPIKPNSAGVYILAQANTADNASSIGVVSASPDVNTFILAGIGAYVTGLPAVTMATAPLTTIGWLSATTAGLLTTTKPTTIGQVQESVIQYDTTTSGYVEIQSAIIGAVGGGTIPNTITINSTQTYTPTVGMKWIEVRMVGGGGSNGVGPSTNTGNASAGGAGGGGGYVYARLTAAEVGASQLVTIGNGGGATGAGGSGNSGQISTFGALLTANGGNGGNTSANSVGLESSQGGSGGSFTITTGTNIGSFNGQAGGSSSAVFIANWMVLSGNGGDSGLGRGALGISSLNANTNGQPANPNTGGGASGSGRGSAQAAGTGGAGGSGRCIITEFY